MEKRKIVNKQRIRRTFHTRRVLRENSDRPRLTVFRSNRHISVQVIDDLLGRTIAAVSTQQKEVADGLASLTSRQAAEKVGRLIAERAKNAGVTQVKFDRGHYRYHGRVAALADAARQAGLEF